MPFVTQQGADLSDEEIQAILDEAPGSAPPQQDLTDDDIQAILDEPSSSSGGKFDSFLPKKKAGRPLREDEFAPPPSATQAFAGEALDQTRNALKGVGRLIDYMGATKPASPGGMRPLSPQDQAFDYSQGPQIGQALTGPAIQGLGQLSEGVDPYAARGTGGALETVGRLAGGLAPQMAATAVNPAAGVAFTGLSMGTPVHEEILYSPKGGDPDKAMAGMLGTAALAPLETLTGIQGTAAKELGEKVVQRGLGQMGKALLDVFSEEVPINVAETMIADGLIESLGGKDKEILQDGLAQVGPTAFLSLIFGLGRGMAESTPRSRIRPTTTEAPGVPKEAVPPEAPTVAPVPKGKTIEQVSQEGVQEAPGAAQPPKAPEVAPKAEVVPTALPESVKAHGERIGSGKLDVQIGAETHPDLRLYRGEPRGTQTPFRAGDGAAGPGTYLAINRRKAEVFAGPEGDVKEIGAPNVRLLRVPANEAINAKDWNAAARALGYDGIWVDGQGEIVLFKPPATPEAQGKLSLKKKAETRREELINRKAHDLTYSEVEEALGLELEHERTADVDVLGEEGAKEWARLHRQQNSSNAAVSDKAAARIAEIEAGLSPEQVNRLYGIGETGMNVETLRNLSRELSDVRSSQNEQELGEAVGLSLARVGQGDPETFSPESEEGVAAAKLREAQRVIEERGFDTAAVSRAALERARRFYGDDAEEMLARWLHPEGRAAVAPEARQIESGRKSLKQPELDEEQMAPDKAPTAETGKATEAKPTKIDEDAEPDEGTVSMMGGLPPLRGGPETKPSLKGRGALSKLGDLVRTHGGKPEAAALMEERARGQVEVEAKRAKAAVKELQRAVAKHNKTGEKVTNGMLFKALTDPDEMAKLPNGVRQAAEKMRTHSDAISRTIVDEGMTSATMSEVIEGRMGSYLRRSYKAHVDPKWAQRVPQDVRNRLESLLVSWSEPLTPEIVKSIRSRIYGPEHKAAMVQRRALKAEIEGLRSLAKTDKAAAARLKDLSKKRMSLRKELGPKTMAQREAHFELQSRRALQGKSVEDIRAEMSSMLQDAKRIAENPWAAFAKSKLKRQDVSLFKARKGLPVEMRNFLGEERNPYRAYTNTILRQAGYVATHRKFREMRSQGLGKWLFEKPTTKGESEFTTRVSAEDNPRLAPLVGDKELYTSETIKKALFDSERAMVSKTWRTFAVVNALFKSLKVVLRPDSVQRQAWSQVATLVRNGHAPYALANPKKIAKAMWGIGPEGKALQEELLRYQVIDSSVAAAEYRDVQEAMANRQINEPYKTALKGNEAAMWAFSQPDNFSKTAGYLSRKKELLKAGFSEESARRHAADDIRNLYPTYSRIIPIVDKFRRQPFIGTFMAFKAEQFRTRVEALRLIARDMKSENPVLVAGAKKRIAWQIAGTLMAPAAAKAWNMLNGVDQEDDERRRAVLEQNAPWDSQRDLAWTDDGRGYVDFSDIDDSSWMTDPLLRIASGEDADKVLMEMWRENVEPFGVALVPTKKDGTKLRPAPSLAMEAFFEYATGMTKYGSPIKSDLKNMLSHLIPPGWGLKMKKGELKFDSEDFSDLSGLRPRSLRK